MQVYESTTKIENDTAKKSCAGCVCKGAIPIFVANVSYTKYENDPPTIETKDICFLFVNPRYWDQTNRAWKYPFTQKVIGPRLPEAITTDKVAIVPTEGGRLTLYIAPYLAYRTSMEIKVSDKSNTNYFNGKVESYTHASGELKIIEITKIIGSFSTVQYYYVNPTGPLETNPKCVLNNQTGI